MARVTAGGAPPCPICGKPAAAAHAPFCSRRCANVDLFRWLSGTYRVASDDPEEVAKADPGEDEPD